ncbi:TadE family protein [Thalassobaculum sp.]|uniref:TadE/TadG family type IV pilus assembly protein n=1 Tax=Thalassobaculum sp. TaxID=2022740 RepID=UPI0032EC2424
MSLALRLHRSTAGSAVVEAAIATPLMLLLTMGAVETTRFVYANMTMQGVAAGAAGELALKEDIDVARVADFMLGAGQLAAPFDFDSSGQVVVSVVAGQPDGSAQVVWQARDNRPGQAASRVGSIGGQAALPAGLTLTAGETVAVAEVFYDLRPLLGVSPEFGGIYKSAVLRPRVGELRPPQ